MGSAIGLAVSQTFASSDCAFAQITPDGTLPNNSRITPSGNSSIIEGGTSAGSNLFHSFEQFSVPTGSTAHFNNALDIQNIISRVTGKSISDIDGLIQANGTANLFLINPNGIVFGKNASLNIGGSFVATTANAIGFGNQGFFSATNPNTPELLTVNPSAFLFNQMSAASIQNNSVAPAGLDPTGAKTYGLRVPNGRSLLLIGGNINMDNGKLRAFGGRVELGGLAGSGTVGLNGNDNNLSLSFPDGISPSDVKLTNGAGVEVRADNGGTIAINARNLEILRGSALLAGIAQELGSSDSKAGNIEINALQAVDFKDGSLIFNVLTPGATGQAGDVNITTGSFVSDNSQLYTLTNGKGNAGNVTINARDSVSFISPENSGFNGILSSVRPGAFGNAGSIKITTGSLSVRNSSLLVASTNGVGNAGDVTINALDTVLFDGVGNPSFSSGAVIGVGPGATGNGGSINITTGSFVARNGALVGGDTSGSGDAGSVTINARDTVLFDGVGSNGFSSGVVSRVKPEAIGKEGSINITAGSLFVRNGAQLDTSTFVQFGNAGKITITARDNVLFDGVGSNTNNTSSSQAISRVNGVTGNGGSINITTGSLTVSNGGLLSVGNNGQGNAGSVTINARDNVLFDGVRSSNSFSSGISSSKESEGTGSAGSINITTGSLFVRNGAELIASTGGQGNAGSVTINARDTVSFDGVGSNGFPSGAFSQVGARATGKGGDINITTGSLSLTNGAQIGVDIRGQNNASSNVTINARDTVLFDGVGSNSLPSGVLNILGYGAIGKGGDTNITTGSLFVRNGAQILADTYGQGDAGNAIIHARDRISLDNARILLNSLGTGVGGNIKIQAGNLTLNNQGLISAETSSTQGGNITIGLQDILLMRQGSQISTNAGAARAEGDGGNITINSPLIVAVPREDSNISANAFTGRGGRVDITATGIFGIQPRSSPTLLSDITASSDFGVSGEVTIDTLDVDPSLGLVNLPTVPIDTEVAQGCYTGGAQAQSKFIITGRGGLPPNPKDVLTPDTAQIDWVSVKPSNNNRALPPVTTKPTTATPKRIVEATGAMLNAKGQIVLTANSSTVTPRTSRQNLIQCYGS